MFLNQGFQAKHMYKNATFSLIFNYKLKWT